MGIEKPDLLLKTPKPRSDTHHFLSDSFGGTSHMATHSCKGFWDMESLTRQLHPPTRCLQYCSQLFATETLNYLT